MLLSSAPIPFNDIVCRDEYGYPLVTFSRHAKWNSSEEHHRTQLRSRNASVVPLSPRKRQASSQHSSFAPKKPDFGLRNLGSGNHIHLVHSQLKPMTHGSGKTSGRAPQKEKPSAADSARRKIYNSRANLLPLGHGGTGHDDDDGDDHPRLPGRIQKPGRAHEEWEDSDDASDEKSDEEGKQKSKPDAGRVYAYRPFSHRLPHARIPESTHDNQETFDTGSFERYERAYGSTDNLGTLSSARDENPDGVGSKLASSHRKESQGSTARALNKARRVLTAGNGSKKQEQDSSRENLHLDIQPNVAKSE